MMEECGLGIRVGISTDVLLALNMACGQEYVVQEYVVHSISVLGGPEYGLACDQEYGVIRKT